VQQAAHEILRAREQEDWASVLTLLRTLASKFDGSTLAFQRFQAYARLGHIDTAYLFLRRAVQLDPTNVRKRYLLWDFAMKAGRGAEALAESEAVLRSGEGEPPLVVAAAHLRFGGLRQVPLEVATPELKLIQTALESVLADPAAFGGSPVSIAILGHTTLAFCHERLGNMAGAMQAFDAALRLDPESDALRVARGLLLARHDMDRAAVEFYEAVRLNSRLVHPYLFLASYALGKDKWAEAKRFATMLRLLSQDPGTEAEALQWSAIASFELGAPWTEVEHLFREAQRLDPLNSRIDENFALCQAARSSGQRRAVPWSRRGPDDFPEAPSFSGLALAA
jgi:tetratricopeptide (TPR) repeat protein